MHIGELVTPDDAKLINFRKATLCQMMKLFKDDTLDAYGFLLPSHKTDPLFQGSSIIIQARPFPLDPKSIFQHYLSHRDSLFPFYPQLWLWKDSFSPS